MQKNPDENKHQIEFFFDVGSPWSYIASTQIEKFEERNNVEFIWRPILLGGLFKHVNNQSPFYVESKNKKIYLLNDISAWVSLYEIPFNFPSQFPPNTLSAMRGALVANEMGMLKVYAREMFSAYFVNDLNISNLDTIIEVVEKIGIDSAEFSSLMGSAQIKQTLISVTTEAATKGAFGVPTFLYKGQIFFGNDRLGLLEHAISKHH